MCVQFLGGDGLHLGGEAHAELVLKVQADDVPVEDSAYHLNYYRWWRFCIMVCGEKEENGEKWGGIIKGLC